MQTKEELEKFIGLLEKEIAELEEKGTPEALEKANSKRKQVNLYRNIILYTMKE